MSIFAKIGMVFASGLGILVSLITSAITVTNGAVTFGTDDATALDSGVGNAIGNLWAGFSFVLPYLGVFLGIALVLGVVMSRLTRGR